MSDDDIALIFSPLKLVLGNTLFNYAS